MEHKEKSRIEGWELSSKPWLKKKEWKTNSIYSSAKIRVYAIWVLAVILGSFGVQVLYGITDKISKGNYLPLIGLVFPIIGLISIWYAWKMTQEWRYYGRIELVMDPFPGSIGGHVGGSFKVKNIRSFTNKYRVTLKCVGRHTSGRGENRTTTNSISWSESGYAKVVDANKGQSLIFRFDIPDHLPESSIESSNVFYFWRLSVLSEGESVPLNRSYDIPVFQTGVNSKEIEHDLSAQVKKIKEDKAKVSQAAIRRGDFSSTDLNRSVNYQQKSGRHTFYYPMFRSGVLGFAWLILSLCLFFMSLGVEFFFFEGEMSELFLLIISSPLGIVGLICALVAIYFLLDNFTVILVGRKIKVIRRFFLFPIKKTSISATDIKKIEIKSKGSTGEGEDEVKHFKLIVHTKDLKKVTISEGIDGEAVAKQLKAFIFKHL